MIKFVKYQKVCLAFTLLAMAFGAWGYWHNGGFVYGIDFMGGTEVRVQFAQDVDIATLRACVGNSATGFEGVSIQNVDGEKQFIIKISEQSGLTGVAIQERLENLLQEKIASPYQVLAVEHVGPEAGKEVRWNTMISILLVLAAMLAYIAVRHRYDYAVGAVVSLAHDVIIMLAFCLVFCVPLTLNILAAILALIGYSLNDTIVVFSRIKDNIKLHNLSKEDLVDLSINQTLTRTLLTSFATFLSMLALFTFGGAVLRDFALTMMIGIVVGTYSSIYIASPVMLLLSPEKGL